MSPPPLLRSMTRPSRSHNGADCAGIAPRELIRHVGDGMAATHLLLRHKQHDMMDRETEEEGGRVLYRPSNSSLKVFLSVCRHFVSGDVVATSRFQPKQISLCLESV